MPGDFTLTAEQAARKRAKRMKQRGEMRSVRDELEFQLSKRNKKRSMKGLLKMKVQ